MGERISSFAERSGWVLDRPEDPIRPAFQRDRDRVVHSKAFRRLKYKTQVFFAPTGDHYRTRLTHTLEVSQIARTIAKVLRLNEELTEAIALGQDLGHTPFGHAGERVLQQLVPDGFNHYEQSLRIVDLLENDGQGLNLTWEVRDGIARHSKGQHGLPVGAPPEHRSSSVEGQVARVADIIAYVNHDIDDAMRAGLLRQGDLPPGPVAVLGRTSSDRIGSMVRDVVLQTLEGGLAALPVPAAGGRGAETGARRLDQAQALERLLAGIERRAIRIARMAVRDRDDALDIVQGAMLRLARNYARRPSDEWKPLFYRILYNGIRDFQRRRSLRSRIFGMLPGQWGDDEEASSDPFEQIAGDVPEPSRQLMADEAMQRLEVAVAQLPERQQQAFAMRCLEGMDVAETATAGPRRGPGCP